jgi:putative hydrolase of HD superfamily
MTASPILPVSLQPTSRRRQLTCPDLGFTPTPKVSGEWEVEKVVEAIPGDAPKTGSQSPLAFFHMIERLKTTKREGWRRFGIERYYDYAFKHTFA